MSLGDPRNLVASVLIFVSQKVIYTAHENKLAAS